MSQAWRFSGHFFGLIGSYKIAVLNILTRCDRTNSIAFINVTLGVTQQQKTLSAYYTAISRNIIPKFPGYMLQSQTMLPVLNLAVSVQCMLNGKSVTSFES